MKPRTLILIICSFLSLPAFSQKDSSHRVKRVNYGIGYSNFRILDKQVSPFVYASHNVPLQFGYRSKKPNTLFEVSFGTVLGLNRNSVYKYREVSIPTISNEGVVDFEVYELANAPIAQQELSVNYYRKIAGLNSNRFEVFAGGELHEQLMISFAGVPVFTFTEVSLNPSILLGYQLNQISLIRAKLSFPVLGFMFRMPYANDPVDGKHGPMLSIYTTGGELTSFHNFQRINYSLEYVKVLSDKWSIGVEYGFYWMRYTKGKGFRAFDNSLMISFYKALN